MIKLLYGKVYTHTHTHTHTLHQARAKSGGTFQPAPSLKSSVSVAYPGQ
jgi:hypothetical protein